MLDELIRLRVDFLLEENKMQDVSEIDAFMKKLRDYFSKWIPVKGFTAIVAEDNDKVCSTAFLSIVERPPRMANSSNLVGTVYNVYTYPRYRRKGIATKVLQSLLANAELLGVASLDLLATEDGKPLYDKLGFSVTTYTSMRIKLKTCT